MKGYRLMVETYLTNTFPETEFKFTEAGIASTCSTTGAFRLESDVLSKGPVDLFFVEFAVNDDQDAAHSEEACIRGMEGIIRHVRTQNPYADIVMTFFLNDQIRESLTQGKEPLTTRSHTMVAEHYGVSTIHLAAEATEQIVNGKLTWEVYGGVHPKPFGNRICTKMIESLFGDSWQQVKDLNASPVVRTLPNSISDFSYSQGRFIPLSEVKDLNGWTLATPDWKNISGSKRSNFTEIEMLSTEQAESTFGLSFTGSALGAYLVAGPDAGIIEVSIDGAPFKKYDTFHRYSKGLHYPRTIVFAYDLDDGEHKAIFKMSKETSSSGTAMRIMHLCGN